LCSFTNENRILSILWSEFKVDSSNDVYDFTVFKFLKDLLILTSYILDHISQK